MPSPPARPFGYIRSLISRPKQRCRLLSTAPALSYNHRPDSMDMGPSQRDWNSNEDFFKFTRERFIVDEATNLELRQVKFDLNHLASIAAASVGASQCIAVSKYPHGMFNKVYLMSMDNGREVIAKVPHPNAGIPYFTTASEVATMDFARNVLDTPAPRVYTWNARAESHPVGAEFIIMDKVEGVPLSQVWNKMDLSQKLKVLVAMTRLQKQWLNVSFSHYGSLYYAEDVQPPAGNSFTKDGMAVMDSKFAIGPATGRDWCDAGRSHLPVERGPWASLKQYLQAVGTREVKALHSLTPPKQLAMFCGPKLYRPDKEKKLTALAWYQQVIDALVPNDTAVTRPRLWHNDLHEENVFVDPDDFGKITGIIDWQSCSVSPLFHHNTDPAFIDSVNPEPETLDLVPLPNRDGLSPEERSAIVRENGILNIFIGWRKLMHAKNPDLYKVVEFRKTPAYGLLFLARRLFEYGEMQFQSLMVDLKDAWTDLPAVTGDMPFPFDFSEAEMERIDADLDGAIAGSEVASKIKKEMGDLWPEKGLIEHERYDDCKAALNEIKSMMLEQLAETDEERAEYERYWPFD